MSDKKVVLSVYFSATGSAIPDKSTLAGALYWATAVDQESYKMGFNGSYFEHGVRGYLFGTGLEEQCKEVVDKIISLLKEGKRVKLNAYGHSRGAVACLLLAKMLGKFDRDLVEVNLALMDPVPGNYVITSTLDFANFTLARQAMDVSQCHNLKRVLAIYPHEPLPDYIAHAPLVPKYPAQCKVTNKIIPGGHSEAQIMLPSDYFIEIYAANFPSIITLTLVSRFLAALGTKLQSIRYVGYAKQQVNEELLRIYNESLQKQMKSMISESRVCHAKSSLSIETRWPATYLSRTHKLLAKKVGEQKEMPEKQHADCAYSFSPAGFHKSNKILSEEKDASTLEDKVALFYNFIREIYILGMSNKSKASTKGQLILQCLNALQEQSSALVANEAALKDAMRNFFALCLQRDRNAYSLFSTTQSGWSAVRLLNSEKYQALANMISCRDNKKLRYRDLRTFVLCRNDASYFNAKKSKRMYRFFQPDNNDKKTRLDASKFFSNNMRFYF